MQIGWCQSVLATDATHSPRVRVPPCEHRPVTFRKIRLWCGYPVARQRMDSFPELGRRICEDTQVQKTEFLGRDAQLKINGDDTVAVRSLYST